MTGNFNSVLTLSEEGDDLVEIGRVDELGENEQIKSVRWFDDLAIVVTFRQTDPFYAVDLTDPASPALLGELKIPGYSEYLHPLGGWRMIGLGQAANAAGMAQGAQAALFDVHDVTDPRRLDVVSYPEGSTALAGQDPRQFTWLPDQRTALTVVTEGYDGTTGYVSVLRGRGRPPAQPAGAGGVRRRGQPGAAGPAADRQGRAGDRRRGVVLRPRRVTPGRRILGGMCRNIRPLHNFEPPATRDEVTAAALQYVRKVSGATKPSQANQAAFDQAVREIAHLTQHLLDDLVTTAPPKDREVEAAKARARAELRYAR